MIDDWSLNFFDHKLFVTSDSVLVSPVTGLIEEEKIDGKQLGLVETREDLLTIEEIIDREMEDLRQTFTKFQDVIQKDGWTKTMSSIIIDFRF